jgi:predicted extracellular nuclease/endonuclease I
MKQVSSKKNNKASRQKSFLGLCITSALLAQTPSYAFESTEIWSEDFNNPEINNKGAVNNIIDMAGVSKWSINIDNASLTASSDWFKVNNAVMEARDVDGIVEWISESVDISNKSNVSISVLASEQGTHESDDFFDLAFSVDGAPFETVTNWQGLGDSDHTLVDDFTASTVVTTIPEGSVLVVKVSMRNGAGSEYIRLDDVIVSYDNESGGEGPVDDTTITNACFNCPDLTKINNATDFSDSIYYETVFDAINANLDSASIKTSVTESISGNHKQLTYSEAWTALTKTDEDPLNTNNVVLFYRGISKAKFSNGSGSQSSDQDNWNREHVWAKSHGFPSISTYAYSDIHHLRPTDISVNSSRGNLDFDNSDMPLAESPENRVDSNSFEPRDAVKGDVARIVLYMDTRYEGFDSFTPDLEVVNYLTSTGEAKLGKLCTLLSWSENDPVDEFEQKRNNTIYEFQGNRNPYIDHPEWISLVYTQDCSVDTTPPTDPVDPDPIDPVDPVDPPEPIEPGEQDLFFSEYIEGSSFNKAVEIFNPTSSIIDLSTYQFKLYSNGSTEPTSTYTLSGMLQPNDVVVLGNTNIDPNGELFGKIDVFSSAINYNGDDYIELVNAETIIDSVGHFGVKESWGSNKTLVRKTSVTQGDNNRDDAFSVEPEWDVSPSNTFSFIGSHLVDDVPPTDPEPSPVIGQCNDSAELISSIQGQLTESPMVGELKTIEGVVTSVVADLTGYFVQEESADMDANSDSSEGIFVYDDKSELFPAIGSMIRVQGEVKENYNRTQFSATASFVDCGVGELIQPTSIQLPVSEFSDWESFEGMLVTFDSTLNVNDTYNLARFGQLTLSNGRRLNPTNVFEPNSEQAIALEDKNGRNFVLLDDKNNQQNPESIPFPSSDLSYNNTVRLGDSVTNLVGILDYSYSDYRVLPTNSVQFVASNPRAVTPTLNHQGNIKIASFNVLNYFNGDGLGGGFPTARGAHTAEEFTRQSEKVVSALVAINADVVGLMEIENDGFGPNSAIADLVNKLNTRLGGTLYNYVLINESSVGTDAIAVGIIYKHNKVELVGNAVTTAQSPFDYGNRQPLVQTFKETTSGEIFTVAVNHFKSKGSCSSATGNNLDLNDGQGCWNELRTQAATGLVSWLGTQPTGTLDSDILIIGDLNAYAKENPITSIEAMGYQNLIANSNGHSAYSYSFGGTLGYLDHALASDSLKAQVMDTTVWHINADEPRAFDYNVENKSDTQLDSYYGNDAYRASDHDPVVISLTLASEKVLLGDFDNDNDIDRNDLYVFTSMLRSGAALDDENDFNKDGLVNSRDVRALMASCTRSRCAVQ